MFFHRLSRAVVLATPALAWPLKDKIIHDSRRNYRLRNTFFSFDLAINYL